jgi:hypothetical protein
VKRLRGKIDRVLVDAPCTGLGTLRRKSRPQVAPEREGLGELNVKQRAILEAAASLVKPGGRLVYGTCSLLREENEDIVDAFPREASGLPARCSARGAYAPRAQDRRLRNLPSLVSAHPRDRRLLRRGDGARRNEESRTMTQPTMSLDASPLKHLVEGLAGQATGPQWAAQLVVATVPSVSRGSWRERCAAAST